MFNRKPIIVMILVLGIAIAVMSLMPPSLDNSTAYPELNHARRMPAEVDALLPGGLCDTLHEVLMDYAEKTLNAPYAERAGWYDQVLNARSDLTKYGCTTP